MTTFQSVTTHLIHTVQKPNESLVAAWLFGDADRAVSNTGDWIQVRVGVMKQADIGQANRKIDFLGSWSNIRNVLRARRALKITGQQDLFYALEVGDIVVLEVTVSGQPSSEVGMSLECEFRRVGSLNEQRDRRPIDADLPPPRRPQRPVFSLGRHIEDANVREAAEVLEADLNTSGITSFFVTYPIAVAMGFVNADIQQESNDDAVAATGSTYQDLEELTLTPPDGRPYIALLWGKSSFEGNNVEGNLRIRNDTDGTNGDSTRQHGPTDGDFYSVPIFHTETITDGGAKTFKLQGNGGAGGSWDDHQLMGILVPLEQATRRLS